MNTGCRNIFTEGSITSSMIGSIVINCSAPRAHRTAGHNGDIGVFPYQLPLFVRVGSSPSTNWQAFANRVTWGTVCIDMQNEDL